ncbi:hypothetical protein [Clostridium grantii]|uniref:HNH endonuclease n=1 Tax=Clostridium grantii DSM 8605 TaxID=1121316 RepID=A0A1M5UQ12_9CLOT|nr:hypothetical protein [Clostridium grantii]SHH65162.1 hypothetical protein SAMN02745207_01882 [Clostridium grantii DSM 8605]
MLRDKLGVVKAKALIDKKDLKRVLGYKYAWCYHKIGDKTYAVANTPKGRVFLDKFILDYQEDKEIKHINLNPLDNKRKNLEVEKVSKKIEENAPLF